MHLEPTRSPILDCLKDAAMRGGLNHPMFDQGILASIKQVETDGYFMRGGAAVLLILLKLEESSGKRLLTDEQTSEGNKFLTTKGWTIDEGAQYANGVFLAEGLLAHFQRPSD
jgi:hypothetical protein